MRPEYETKVKRVNFPSSRGLQPKNGNVISATDLIASRIVRKQLELDRKVKNSTRRFGDILTKPQIAVRWNNVVVQRILHIQMKEKKYNKPVKTLFSKPESAISISDQSRRTSVLSFSSAKQGHPFPISRTSSKISVLSNCSTKVKKVRYSQPLELPRFHLNSGAQNRRKVENKAVQVRNDGEVKTNAEIQTEFGKHNKDVSSQAATQPILSSKKLQTRLYKKSDYETDPVSFVLPSKSVNTLRNVNFAQKNQHTRMFEFMSESDFFCLDWINKYLFPIEFNPFAVVVDEKLRDVSEVCTKSTLFSESKSLKPFLYLVKK